MTANPPSRDLAVASVQLLHAYLRNSRPVWTHDVPTGEGYFWLKQPKGYGEVIVVRVRLDYSEFETPFVVQIGEPEKQGVQYLRDFEWAQWCGPLEIPANE